MKILCPTDFSDNSKFACEYAVDLGNSMKAKIIFLSAYQVKQSALVLKSLDETIKSTTEEDLKEFTKSFKQKIKTSFEPEYVVVSGNTCDCIVNHADKNGVDLIIMGTKGSSGIINMLLGSVTSDVIKKSNVPVLAIPEITQYYLPDNTILLALDSKGINSDRSIQLLKRLLSNVDTTIDVLHVNIPGEKIELSKTAGKLVGIVSNIIEIDGLDPVEEIKKYVDDNNIGILVMVRRKHSYLETLLFETNTVAELFASNVPLLVLPEMMTN